MYLISNITQETSPLCPLQQCNRKGSEKKCQNKHDPDVYLCFLSSLEKLFFFFLAIFLIFKDGVKMIKKADKSKKLKRLSCLFPFLEKKKYSIHCFVFKILQVLEEKCYDLLH